MSWDPNDPYGYYGSHGGFPPENPRPEDSPDWEDVPQVNRKYVRQIPREVIHERFEHLKTNQIYVIEALVKSIEISEDLLVRPDNQKKIGKMATSLKIMNLPVVDLNLKDSEENSEESLATSEETFPNIMPPMSSDNTLEDKSSSNPTDKNTLGDKSASKTTRGTTSTRKTKSTNRTASRATGRTDAISESSSRVERRRNTITREKTTTRGKTQTKLAEENLPITNYFKNILRYLTKFVKKAKKPLEEAEGMGEEAPQEEVKEEEEPVQAPVQGVPGKEVSNRTVMEVMEGNTVMMVAKGCEMVRKLQTSDLKVFLGLLDDSDSMGSSGDDKWPLGEAVLKFPPALYHAVLRRETVSTEVKASVKGYQEEEVAVANMVVTLVTLGQGAEVGISGNPAYTWVKPIKELPLLEKVTVVDPLVQPRLAVTLMNLEPSREIYKTSSQIIQDGLQKEWISLENAEGFSARFSKYNPSNCRWPEIAQQSAFSKSAQTLLGSKSNLSVRSNALLMSSDPPENCQRHSQCYTNVAFPGESDPEIRPLWREMKKKCGELHEEFENLKTWKRVLYEELDELLELDKPEVWGEDVTSNTSKPSRQEDQASRTTSRKGSQT